jgi:hypothetical protein
LLHFQARAEVVYADCAMAELVENLDPQRMRQSFEEFRREL